MAVAAHPTSAGTEDPHVALAGLFARVRRRRRALSTAAGAGLSLLSLSVFGLSAALAVAAFPIAAVRWTALATLPVLGLLPLCLALLRWARPGARADEALARELAAGDARLRSLLLSAVQLGRSPAPGISLELIRAQARSAVDASRRIDPVRALPARPAQVAIGLGIVAAGLAAAAVLKGPPALRRGLAALRRLPPKPPTPPDPITGDIELTLFFPPHTRLAPRTTTGTNGEIDAPAGTDVRLETRADRPVTQASIVLNGPVDGQVIPMSIAHERQLSGRFQVTKAGSYAFEFGPADHPTAVGPPIRIAIQVDEPPQVVLEAPPETLEVDPGQVVDLRYRAQDDYGLSELRLQYRPPGAEEDKVVVLKKFATPETRFAGSSRFDLGPLRLMSGDEVLYTVEAVDNDSVSGPKSARSKPHKLKVFSAAEHHREALERARALFERLLSLLGDRLQEQHGEVDGKPSASPSPVDDRALVLSADLDRAAAELARDKAQERSVAMALANIGRRERTRASSTADARELAQTFASRGGQSTGLRRALTSEVSGLESDVLYLESLLDESTKADLVSLSRELAARRRDLAKLVEQYRKAPSEALKAQLFAELNRLKARTAEMMRRWSELAKGLSDQHLNREALAALGKDKDVASGLQSVEDQLRKGDVNGALSALDRIGAAIDSMQQLIGKAQSGASQANAELGRKVQQFRRDLADVQHEQSQIRERTEKVRQAARKSLDRRSPLEGSLLQKLREEAQRAHALLSQLPDTAFPPELFSDNPLPEARERATEVEKSLEARDLDQALHSTEDALRLLGVLEGLTDRDLMFGGANGMPGAEPDTTPDSLAADLRRQGVSVGSQDSSRPQSGEDRGKLTQAEGHYRSIREKLEQLLPDEESLLSPAQKDELQKLQKNQLGNEQKAERLSEKLHEMMEEAPLSDASAEGALRDASLQMREAAQSLSRARPGPALGQEQEAESQLDRLSQSMQPQSGQGSAGAGGLPNPFGLEPPGAGSEEGIGQEAVDHEVVIPGADQYQVPAEFRRDILDAMKQKPPRPYEDQVKRYYQEIVK